MKLILDNFFSDIGFELCYTERATFLVGIIFVERKIDSFFSNIVIIVYVSVCFILKMSSFFDVLMML